MMDAYLQRNFPTVLAPRFSALAPMTEPGERFVLTSSKLLFEVSRPWLHAVHAISKDFDRKTPYGEGLPEGIELKFGAIPKEMLEQFIELARLAFPLETAAWIVWNEDSGDFNLMPLKAISSSANHVHFERPTLPGGQHLVMDIHSHGEAEAFFSSTDDQDDIDQLCVSAVVGRVNSPTPMVIARLSMLGVYKRLY